MDSMAMKILLVPVLFILLLIPNTSALEAVPAWQSECLNNTHVLKVGDILDINDGTSILSVNMTIQCNYGCNTERDICNKWPLGALPGEYFMLFEIVGLAMLFTIIFRLHEEVDDTRPFDVILSVMSFIVFLLLALQGNNVIDISTGEAVQITMAVWLNYGFSVLSLAFVFYNMFKFAHGTIKEGMEGSAR